MKILYSTLLTTLLLSGFHAKSQQTNDTKLLSASAPLTLVKQHNQVIENLSIHDVSEAAIVLTDCSDMVIRRCTIRNGQKAAIVLTRCSNITIEDNAIENFTGGVTCTSSTGGIVVQHNFFKNVRAVGQTQGHFVRFEGVTGLNNRIELNYGVNVAGESSPEVAISVVGGSGGTAASPLLVRQNYLNGGGPSNSGGGIAIGENGSNYIVAEENVLINPGQYGLGITGGTGNQLVNNVVYGAPQACANVGTYVWGGPYPVKNPQLTGNRVYFRNRNSVVNGFWSAGAVGMLQRNNNWSDTTITATYAAPAGAGIRPLGPTLPPTSTGVFYRAVNVGGDSLTLDGHHWLGGTDPLFTSNTPAASVPTNTLLYPLPALNDAARARMARTFVAGSSLQLQLRAVPAGQYNVYAYVSTWNTTGAPFTLRVQNDPKQTVQPDTLAGSWKRVGPYLATVDASGQLQLQCEGEAVSLSGLELWRLEDKTADAVLATRPASTTSVQAYPNPFQEVLNLQVALPAAEKLEVEVLNTLGVCVARTTLVCSAGVSTQHLSLGHLASGRYVLRFVSGSLQNKHVALIK